MSHPSQFSFECVGGQYLSIQPPLDWQNVPPVAIISGENGAGKTQLIQALAWALVPPKGGAKESTLEIRFPHAQYGAGDVLHVQARWSVQDTRPLALGSITEALLSLAQEVLGTSQASSDRKGRARIEALRGRLIPDPSCPPKIDELVRQLQHEEFLDPPQGMASIAQRFLHFHLRVQEHRLTHDGCSEEELRTRFGKPPWETLNDLLASSGMHYRVTAPTPGEILTPYHLRLRDERTSLEISPQRLSSGESALFNLFMMLFTSSEYSHLPKLLLLDEPDAHLHTAQIPGFFRALTEQLVKIHGCRVIMSTHRPDTLVLAPPGTLFEMRRHETPRVRAVADPASLLSSMTASVLSLLPGIRCVFVEDVDDVKFYETIYEVACDNGFPLVPRLRFMTQADGSGSARSTGGAGTVKRWVAKLKHDLPNTVVGIIDGDGEPPEFAVVSRIARYSIENYLFDPIVVYTALADLGQCVSLEGVPAVTAGQSQAVANFADKELQAVVDQMLARLPKPDSKGSDELRELSLSVGARSVVLNYPVWFLDWRGHDLAHRTRATFPKTPGNHELLRALRRLQLVPMDIRAVFEHIAA